MSIPLIEETSSGYRFDWVEGIAIDVSRLHNHNNGDVTGEIRVRTKLEGIPPHLHQAKFNFSSSQTRRNLARILHERFPGADWYEVLEQLTVKTLEKLREGAPVQELLVTESVEPPRYVIHPLIIEGYPNILFGDPSAGKSTLAVVLAQTMMLPWRDNNIGLQAPASQVRCLYLDWEADDATLRWLTTLFARGLGLNELSLLYRRCAGPLSQDIDQVRFHVDAVQASVVIIDSLGPAAGGDLNAPEIALEFFTALRKIRGTALVLAHNKKPDENDKGRGPRSVFGSMFFTAMARNIWEVRKHQEPGSPEMDLALFHRKPAPFSQLHRALGLHFSYYYDDKPEEASMVVSRHDPTDVDEFVSQLGNQQRILLTLREGPLSPKDISEATGIKAGSVRTALKRLKENGKIIDLPNSYYGLATRIEI